MEPLKEIYSKEWIHHFANTLFEVDSNLNSNDFRKKVLTKNWESFELKERMDHLANTVLGFWGEEPKVVFKKLVVLVKNLRSKGVPDFNFPYIFLNDIIPKIGLKNFEFSMRTLEELTIFSSAEYAIRHFYHFDFQKTLQQMIAWASHKEPLVRRLASEGSRPLLPWGLGVTEIKKNPKLHLEILEKLWDDPDEIVRRSVSNHLNDISKLEQNVTLDFCLKRMGKSETLDKSLRHALRTLLKKGNPKALNAFGYNTIGKPKKIDLHLDKKKISVGDSLNFSILISHTNKTNVKVRFEYKIGFCLANGKISKKVFQLGEKILIPNQTLEIKKSHSFKPITTKTYYTGLHEVAIVANGVDLVSDFFHLKVK